MQYLYISENKLKHSLGVARYMQKYASERLLNDDLASEYFVLGYLHDIGEEFVYDKKDHAKVGGTILKSQNYKYWKEVYHHGDPNTPYMSVALMVLNLAELCVQNDGTVCTIEQNLERLKNKFGEDSVQYKNTKALADMVRTRTIVIK
ncbi:MAG: HD domain-containing protein [Coprobacillus sp.]|nr:HD domain-containing protein [Coprobacillus sp.]MDY4146175.1 HD domain-containing protein [Bacilli bacterium]CCY08349.1 hD domain protein [Coprobacillus sp. CAG:698]